MTLWVTRTARERIGLADDWFGDPSGLHIDSFAEAHALAEELRVGISGTPPGASPIDAADLAALDLLQDLASVALDRVVEASDPELVARAEQLLLDHFGADRGRRMLERFSQELGVASETSADIEVDVTPSCVRELLLVAVLGRHERARWILRRLGLDGRADPELGETLRLVDEVLEDSGATDGEVDRLAHLLDGGGESFERPLNDLLAEPGAWEGGDLRRVESVLGLIAESKAPRFPPGHAPEPVIGLTGKGAPEVGEPMVGGPPSSGEPRGVAEERPAPHSRRTRASVPETLSPSPDEAWMPGLVMVAKNALVWLDQLSRHYGRLIERLDEIPEAELETLGARGFTGLWLVGIWERSPASARIKESQGQSRPFPSAYAIRRYRIARRLGGEAALETLSERATRVGIRLAADFVPNHTSIDSDWVLRHPERFISVPEPPFPGYRFTGDDLSPEPGIELRIEDHYRDHSDAAVVFERRDQSTGEVRYIFHGNDGTATPWNDTAQLDYLNPETREAVIEAIVRLARQIPILRFDAAMTLARQHFHRLWHPAAGHAGAIPSRAEHGLSGEEILELMPREIWIDVVERLREEAPGTLLVAEAFWLMEGYFVRSLGLHRVYNSAFMHMVRDGQTARLRRLIADTLDLDRGMLGRFVNYLSNPDEAPAVEQLGSGDRYIGACRLLVTLPGLPLFAHGQWEGLSEKYGMEYRRARTVDQPDRALMARHDQEVAPLLAKRSLFAGVDRFGLLETLDPEGQRIESVLAFTNQVGQNGAVVAFNNSSEAVDGVLRGDEVTSWAALFGESTELVEVAGERRLPIDPETERLPIRLEPWECAVLVAGRGGRP